MEKLRVVHYINQFFAGIGGEEKADTKPHVAETLPPISVQLNKLLGDDMEIVGTVVCGDTYFNENLESASAEVLGMIKGFDPQFGARPVKRVVQREVLNKLSKEILAGRISPDSHILLDCFDGEFVFRNQDVVDKEKKYFY